MKMWIVLILAGFALGASAQSCKKILFFFFFLHLVGFLYAFKAFLLYFTYNLFNGICVIVHT